eukprot:11399150-Karenia_brevis.AAC.1
MDTKLINEWILRHHRWEHKVYVDASTHIPTPLQQHVLHTIHFRRAKGEYQLLGEKLPPQIWQERPDAITVDTPLLRLVHGLPGSGK